MTEKFQDYYHFIIQRYLWRITLFVVSFAAIIAIFAHQFSHSKTGWLVSFAACLAFLTSFSVGALDANCYQCRRVTRFVYRRRKKIKTIAIGYTINYMIDWLFDNPLYIFVIAERGPFVGGLVMMLLSAAACLATILFYNWSKTDWFGFSVVNGLRDHGDEWMERVKNVHIKTRWMRIAVQSLLIIPSKFFALAIWLLNKGDVPAFFVMTLFYDPFMTVTYFRRGSFTKLTTRDWYIFWASVVIANVYWTARSFAVLEIILVSYRTIFK